MYGRGMGSQTAPTSCSTMWSTGTSTEGTMLTPPSSSPYGEKSSVSRATLKSVVRRLCPSSFQSPWSALPGPGRRSSVHSASMHEGAALFTASRLPYEREQHQACPSLMPSSAKMSHLGKAACVVVVDDETFLKKSCSTRRVPIRKKNTLVSESTRLTLDA